MISTALASLLVAAPARSELYQIANVPNSTSTNIFGVNDSGIATGSWLDEDGVEHGYVGRPDGSDYTTFDDPNEPGPGTEPRGISDKGYICGFGDSSSGSVDTYVTWERNPKNTVTEITRKGTVLNYFCQGFNGRNEFAGSYANASLGVVAYLGQNEKFKKSVTLKNISNTAVGARGIDDAGDVVGWYYDTRGVQNGFLLSGGRAFTIAFPGANYTVLEGINNKHQIAGQYQDTSGVLHGFIYDISAKTFREIKVPGAVSFVQAWGINDMGQVAIGSDVGYYVYCPSSKNCFGGNNSFKHPTWKLQPLLP